MTKKDYELIARVIRNAPAGDTYLECKQIKTLIELLSAAFKEDSELFDEKKFYAACGWH